MEFAIGIVVGVISMIAFATFRASRTKKTPAEAWRETVSEVRLRQAAICELSGFSKIKIGEEAVAFKDHPAKLQLAATDTFVQKAQDELISRKIRMHGLAIASIVSFIFISFAFAWYMDLPSYIKNNAFQQDEIAKILAFNQTNTITPWAALYVIVRGGTLLAAYLFLLYLSVALFRAFLHEATIIENRIHAIRLGRLYIYLRLSHIDSYSDLAAASAKITSEDLERVFGWNIETSTAFKDINPELANRGVISQIASAFAGAVSNKA